MNFITILLLISICASAGFVQRVSGFGLGIVNMIFLPYLLSSHSAAASISVMVASISTTFNAIRYRKRIAYKTVLPMILSALISIPVAVRLSTAVSEDFFMFLLGCVLILLSLYFMFFNKHIRMKATMPSGIISGALSGILNGLFSTGGPPAVLYLSNATANNITYFATIQFFFCFMNLYTSTMRFAGGIITPDILLYSVIGMAGCMLGDFAGRFVFDKLNAEKLKLVIYIGMILSGIIMLF